MVPVMLNLIVSLIYMTSFFEHVLNVFMNNLQFTCDFSKDKIHLLNMQVVLNNGALSTAAFYCWSIACILKHLRRVHLKAS